MQKNKIYGLNNDYLFKKIFGKEYHAKQLIKDLFDQEVTEIKYLEKEFKKENKQLSYGICDLLLDEKNKMIVLELQNKNLKNIEPRMCMYLSKLYAEHGWDKEYRKIKPIEILLILNYSYKSHKTLKRYREIEKTIQEEFGKYFHINIWNIKEALKEKNTMNQKYALLFSLSKKTEIKGKQILQELEKETRFKSIIKEIKEYNMDKEEYQRMKEVEIMEMTFEQATSLLLEDAKKQAIKDGKRVGRREGRREGRRAGKIEGKQEKTIEMVKNMILENIPIEKIMRITSLSEKEIEQYQKQEL